MTPLARPGATVVLFALLVVVLLPLTAGAARGGKVAPSGVRVAGATVTAPDEPVDADPAPTPSAGQEPTDASGAPTPVAPADPLGGVALGLVEPGTTCESPDLSCLDFAGYDGVALPGLTVDDAGHSSTNYVAHRLVGSTGARPEALPGVLYPPVPAEQWDVWTVTATAPPGVRWSVVVTPRPGDVAQWEADERHPAGRVAWVDQVGVDAAGQRYLVLSASTVGVAPPDGPGGRAWIRVVTGDAQDVPDRYLRPATD